MVEPRAPGLLLAPDGVDVEVRLADGADAPAGEECRQVRDAVRVLAEVPAARRFVVLAEILLGLLVPHAIGPRHDRLPFGDAPSAPIEEPLGLGLLLGARALTHGAAVHVVLAPPHAATEI
jgi:hypothetical protein